MLGAAFVMLPPVMHSSRTSSSSSSSHGQEQPPPPPPPLPNLSQRQCAACEGGTPRLSAEDIRHRYLPSIHSKWQWLPASSSPLPSPTTTAAATERNDAGPAERIAREWRFRNFPRALAFINRVGAIFEAEQHHGDVHLTRERCLRLELCTFAVGGLTENDFVMAAKIDQASSEFVKQQQQQTESQ